MGGRKPNKQNIAPIVKAIKIGITNLSFSFVFGNFLYKINPTKQKAIIEINEKMIITVCILNSHFQNHFIFPISSTGTYIPEK